MVWITQERNDASLAGKKGNAFPVPGRKKSKLEKDFSETVASTAAGALAQCNTRANSGRMQMENGAGSACCHHQMGTIALVFNDAWR